MDGGAATYAYDGEGRRMKKTTSTETTYTFYGPGGILCEFSTVNTGATAAATTDRTLYRTSERTGTAVLLFTTSGTVIENNRTLPYGEAWLSDVASANDKKFTTYDRDKESGLDYAMARMYSSRTGRFTTLDPEHVGARLEDPRSWNPYVYTGNDPINLVDPQGTDYYTVCQMYRDGGYYNQGDCNRIDPEDWEYYLHLAAQDGLIVPSIGRGDFKYVQCPTESEASYEICFSIQHVIDGSTLDDVVNGGGPFGFGRRTIVKGAVRTAGSTTTGRSLPKLTETTVTKFLKSATTKAKYGGTTRVGTALQKHAARPGSWFSGKAFGGNATQNTTAGEGILRDILHRGSVKEFRHQAYGQVIDV